MTALQADVRAAIDAFDLTGAVDRIWALVRALNRHVTEQKPWELAKDDAQAGRLDQVLFDLADGLRVCAVALAAVSTGDGPEDPLGARSAGDLRWEQVEYGAWRRPSGSGRRRRFSRGSSRPPTRRDRHPRAPRRTRRRGPRTSPSAG